MNHDGGYVWMSYTKEKAGCCVKPIKQLDKYTWYSSCWEVKLMMPLPYHHYLCLLSFIRSVCGLTCLRGRSLVSFFHQKKPTPCSWRHVRAWPEKQHAISVRWQLWGLVRRGSVLPFPHCSVPVEFPHSCITNSINPTWHNTKALCLGSSGVVLYKPDIQSC